MVYMDFLLDGKRLKAFGTMIFLAIFKIQRLVWIFYGFLVDFNESVTCTFSLFPLPSYKSTVYCIRGYPRACKQNFTMIKKEKIVKLIFFTFCNILGISQRC
jgi:hypothetical protein